MIRSHAYFGTLMALFVPAFALASPIGPITKIVVTESGRGPENESCSAFSLTTRQVQEFLDKAVLISGRQQHDYFLYGPCFIRGTVETRYDTWQFEIRNLGTGSITATNGDVFLLADPEQESSLADG
jgi:hypothetical protein